VLRNLPEFSMLINGDFNLTDSLGFVIFSSKSLHRTVHRANKQPKGV